MSKKSNNEALAWAAAIGLLGLGMAGAAALTSPNAQEVFTSGLSIDLALHGIHLVSCHVARDTENAPIWQVTIQHPIHGVMTLSARFPADTDVYASGTRQQLSQRIVSFFQGGAGLGPP